MPKPVLPIAALAALVLAGCAASESGPSAKAAPAPAVAAAPSPGGEKSCAPAPKELVKRDLEPGEGEPITFRTAVLVHYTGWLYDGCAPGSRGKQFDTSVGKNVPFGLVVGAGRVIQGWDEGLIGMRPKAKRLLVIPPDKGYGERGAGNVIPPNATLVFEVELVQVLNRPAPQAPTAR